MNEQLKKLSNQRNFNLRRTKDCGKSEAAERSPSVNPGVDTRGSIT